MVRTLPMFPLGSVLFPAMPLRLRVFEERYLIMLSQMVEHGDAEFGVVLIERGQEVGGGEHRFQLGTVAEIMHVGAEDGFVSLLALGRGRVRVQEWLPDDPYPRAEVDEIPALTWDVALEDRLQQSEQRVRRTLAVASEFSELLWSPDVELAEDPLERCWQLAGITPAGSLDQHHLLAATSVEQILDAVEQACDEAEAGWRAPWPDEGGDPDADLGD